MKCTVCGLTKPHKHMQEPTLEEESKKVKQEIEELLALRNFALVPELSITRQGIFPVFTLVPTKSQEIELPKKSKIIT